MYIFQGNCRTKRGKFLDQCQFALHPRQLPGRAYQHPCVLQCSKHENIRRGTDIPQRQNSYLRYCCSARMFRVLNILLNCMPRKAGVLWGLLKTMFLQITSMDCVSVPGSYVCSVNTIIFESDSFQTNGYGFLYSNNLSKLRCALFIISKL